MGNAFLQMFMRGGSAALRAVQGFGAKAAPKVVKQVADTVTNPQTYRALAEQAGFGQVGSLVRNLAPGGATGLRGTAVLGGMGGMAWGLADPTPMIDASHGLLGFLQDRNLVYDPRKDPRVTLIQNRPVVNPGELAPDYSGARDRSFRFAQYQEMGKTPVGGGAPPPAPTLPAPPLAAGAGSQTGQRTAPPSVTSDVPVGGSFTGGPTYQGTGVFNGAGVPALRQNVQNRALSQEVLNAAQQYAAPTSVPLSSFYEGQQQLGRSMLKDQVLQRQLQDLGGATGMTPEALNQWATENPGVAYQLLQKLKRRSQ